MPSYSQLTPSSSIVPSKAGLMNGSSLPQHMGVTPSFDDHYYRQPSAHNLQHIGTPLRTPNCKSTIYQYFQLVVFF